MREPDVVLTDWALAIECAVFARRLGWSSGLARSFACLFAATALSSLAGGTAHGFRAASDVLWTVALLGLGVAAAAAWVAGARLVAGAPVARVVGLAATVELAVYAAAVIGGRQPFALAIANYCAASAVLLCGLAARFARTRERAALVASAGVGGIFAGAAMQQAGVAFPAAHLDHNALFHVAQGAALALLFAGASRLARRDPCSHDDVSS